MAGEDQAQPHQENPLAFVRMGPTAHTECTPGGGGQDHVPEVAFDRRLVRAQRIERPVEAILWCESVPPGPPKGQNSGTDGCQFLRGSCSGGPGTVQEPAPEWPFLPSKSCGASDVGADHLGP